MIYTTFAQLYDKLMDPQMYRDWVSYFDRYEFEKNSNILDLACGSGRFAVEIAKKGYDIVTTSRFLVKNKQYKNIKKEIILSNLFYLKTHQKITDATCVMKLYN